MGSFNTSFRQGFFLVGFSDFPQLELLLSVLISIFYSLTLFGNSTIIILSQLDARLQMPMYFFLCHLSFLDLCYTTSIVPQLLINLQGYDRTISYGGCVAQLFLFLALATTESVLLVVMAFDRYVAVCRPLHYTTIMHPVLCLSLAIVSWVGGFMNSLIQTSLMMAVPLCGHRLNHFFCEIPPLLLLSCSSTYINSVMTLVADVFLGGINFMLTLLSYGFIIASILRMRSAEGKRKAFSTCSSHLIVVSVYYSSVFCAYISPASSYSPERSKFTSVLYSVVSPTLNPLIYTLRNKDVKLALGRILASFSH